MLNRIGANISLVFAFISPALASDNIQLPLTYYPSYGIYTTTMIVGFHPSQELEVIVDTGSSSLVFVGDEKICPTCNKLITQGRLDFHQFSDTPQKSSFHLTYGTGSDDVFSIQTALKFGDNLNTQLLMQAFVIQQSTQPANILGLIHHNLRKDYFDFTPFLVKVTENYQRYDQFSFIFCNILGKSKLILGKFSPEEAPLLTAQRVASKFYEIETSGFYDHNNLPIAKTYHAKGAILDTGTGGYIIISPKLYDKVIPYLYKYSGETNQRVDKNFWKNNYCIDQTKIEISKFPTLKLGFIDSLKKKPIFLKLPPTVYINTAGCQPGYVRIEFTKGLPQDHPTAIRNHGIRAQEGTEASMVLGTSFLNNYVMKVSLKEPKYITFFDNKKFCSQ